MCDVPTCIWTCRLLSCAMTKCCRSTSCSIPEKEDNSRWPVYQNHFNACTRVHAYICTCMCTSLCMCVRLYTHTHTHMYIHIHAQSHKNICMHEDTHTYMHTNTTSCFSPDMDIMLALQANLTALRSCVWCHENEYIHFCLLLRLEKHVHDMK